MGDAPRPNIQALRALGTQNHQSGLTPALLTLFVSRGPLKQVEYTRKRKPYGYTGISEFLSNFADPGDPEYQQPFTRAESRAEKKARVAEFKSENGKTKLAEMEGKWDPKSDPNATEDPYKTLFVARVSYETTESKLKREFEAFGPIKTVRLVQDKDKEKSRGYAFIEYHSKTDMKMAYKQADGMKIDGRRVVVDVERGRSVPDWKPRRLGGGLGGTRLGGKNQNVTHSGRAGEGGRGEERDRGGYGGGGYRGDDRGRDSYGPPRDSYRPPPRDDRGYGGGGYGGGGGSRYDDRGRGGGYDDRDRGRGGGYDRDSRGGGGSDRPRDSRRDDRDSYRSSDRDRDRNDDRGSRRERDREPGEVGGGRGGGPSFPISDGRDHRRERDY